MRYLSLMLVMMTGCLSPGMMEDVEEDEEETVSSVEDWEPASPKPHPSFGCGLTTQTQTGLSIPIACQRFFFDKGDPPPNQVSFEERFSYLKK